MVRIAEKVRENLWSTCLELSRNYRSRILILYDSSGDIPMNIPPGIVNV